MGEWRKIIVSSSDAHLNTVTASGGFSGSNLNPLLAFNGNREISNGDLSIVGQNFQTTGDVSEFLEAVFFKNEVPTIPEGQVFYVNEFTQGETIVGTIQATDSDVESSNQNLTFLEVSYSDPNVADVLISQGVIDSLPNPLPYNILANGSIRLNSGTTANPNFNIDSNAPNSGSSALGNIPINSALPIPVKVRDNFGASSIGVVYLAVVPNSPPILFNINSNGTTGDRLITLDQNIPGTYPNGPFVFSSSVFLPESSTSGVKPYTFGIKYLDSDNDTVSVEPTVPQSNQFEIFNDTAQNRILLNQLTSSLDFDVRNKYDFSILFADEHGESTTLLYHFEVSDNTPPFLTNVTPTIFVDETVADSTIVTTLTPTDSDGDLPSAYIFENFSLQSVKLDGAFVTNLTNTNNDIFNPNENPFTINNNGEVIKIPGTFLNADIANQYIYTGNITDVFNEGYDSTSFTLTININDDDLPTGTLNHSSNNYIIESAESNAFITKNSTGIVGANSTKTEFFTTPEMNWEINTVPPGYIKSTHDTASFIQFQVDTKISESGLTFDNNSTIKLEITGSKTSFNSTKIYKETFIQIAKNNAPIIGEAVENSVLNTNEATSNTILCTHTLSDPESDTIPTNIVTVPSSSDQLSITNNGSSIIVKAANNLSVGTYGYTASISDNHNFRTSSIFHSIVITKAGNGSFSGGSQFHIVETGLTNDIIHNTTGFTNGTENGGQATLTITYDSSEGSPTLDTMVSSDDRIAIDITGNSGKLKLNQNISGSITQAGDSFTSTITYTDNYGNSDTENIQINIFANDPPITSNYTEQSSNLFTNITSTIGTHLVTFTIDDDEHDYAYSASISGTDSDKLSLISQNSNNSSYNIVNSTAINPNTTNPGAGESLSFNITVFDTHGLSSTTSHTLNISDAVPTIYAYTYDDLNITPNGDNQVFKNLGQDVVDSNLIHSGSVLGHFLSGSLGSSSFTTLADSSIPTSNNFMNSATCTKRSTVNITDLKSTTSTNGLASLGNINLGDFGEARTLILFPSTSLLSNKPKEELSILSTNPVAFEENKKEFRSYYKKAADGQELNTSFFVKYFNLSSSISINGYSKWGIIAAAGRLNVNAKYFMVRVDESNI